MVETVHATVSGVVNLWLAQDWDADLLLESSPLALLIGMWLEQQIPLEVAFAGPKK
ncbi:Base excision DNA repair protein,HhH-GPD family protein [Mycobacteroides abscessus subsp. abscessus]|nr:Base excision DNA repair protein,HhH-GPD family protein [Mycobacteroides abscessus subsp. abscessus]SHV44566.1 Base excision DNA repair protein,HhH-GPD family protein [Mycobacteroides abscessus subsp. abscessus]SHV57113.1 Base excision DNA repair protein,HhH-GPD family protein [Mycobacteroides abscessus subsp. abscessus]SHV78659.1 Base excision DNA repair protein,HhH-GPD family protein [Mycobacteroides abscessus subsp. abscessus]SHW44870.1 Base excision DNA repair protein,HhH-GPD family prot